MAGLIDNLTERVFGVMDGFGGMTARPADDPITKEYKRLQRGVVAAVLNIAGAIFFGLGMVAVLSKLEGNATFGQLADALRAPAGTIVFTIMGLACLYFVYASVSLYRFIRKQDLGC